MNELMAPITESELNTAIESFASSLVADAKIVTVDGREMYEVDQNIEIEERTVWWLRQMNGYDAFFMGIDVATAIFQARALVGKR